jgi:hypothetical protein
MAGRPVEEAGRILRNPRDPRQWMTPDVGYVHDENRACDGSLVEACKGQPPGDRVVFFREETDVILQGQEAAEESLGLLPAPDQGQGVDQPEAAGEKHSLTGGQSIPGVLVRDVAHHEPISHELALDGLDGAEDARIGGREKAHLGDEQQRGIELG